MITPLDIQNKEFKKSLRGYSPNDVDSFLDEVNNGYENIYRENIELKDKIGMLTDQIRRYNNLEETLKSTLVLAQSTADDVTSSARKKAELIIEDAELRAQKIIRDSIEDVKDIKLEYESINKEMNIFKTKYKSFIQAQLMSLEEFYEDYDKTENIEEFNEENEEILDVSIEKVVDYNDDNKEVEA